MNFAIHCFFFLFSGFLVYRIYQWWKTKSYLIVYPALKLRYRGYEPQTQSISLVLRILVLLFLALAVYYPTPPIRKIQTTEVKSVDILFLIDVSLSMNAIDGDRSSDSTRLDRVKESILRLVPDLEGNRLGILAFAGSPFLYCPMTTDHSAFVEYLRGMDVDMIGERGSDLKRAFQKANDVLLSNKLLRNRILVLVSDGEDMDKPSLGRLPAHLVVWSVGTTTGAPLVYKDVKGTKGYLTTKGSLVLDPTHPSVLISKSNLDLLRQIASKSQGEFADLTKNSASAWNLLDLTKTLDPNTIPLERKNLLYDSSYIFLFMVCVFLFLDISLLLYRSGNRPRSGWGYHPKRA